MSKKLDKYLASQQKLAEFGTSNNKLAESLSAIGLFYQQPTFDISKTIISPTFLKYERASQVIENMTKLGSIVASSPRGTLVNSNLQQQAKLIQERLAFLTPYFEIMSVHKNYVSVPESLIPDDFIYEEVVDDATNESNEIVESAITVKKLSFSDTLTLIQMLFGALAWTISFIMTYQNSLQEQKNHDEQIAIETQRNQILQNGFEDIVDSLIPIYSRLEEIEDAIPKNDSLVPSADYPASSSESSRPIKADEPDDSGTPRKVD